MEKTIELLIIIMLLAIMTEIYLLVKPRRQARSCQFWLILQC